LLADHGEAGTLRLAPEGGRGREHSAREDVLLDEVGADAVAIEQRVVDDDGLDAGAAPGFRQRCRVAKYDGQ